MAEESLARLDDRYQYFKTLIKTETDPLRLAEFQRRAENYRIKYNIQLRAQNALQNAERESRLKAIDDMLAEVNRLRQESERSAAETNEKIRQQQERNAADLAASQAKHEAWLQNHQKRNKLTRKIAELTIERRDITFHIKTLKAELAELEKVMD